MLEVDDYRKGRLTHLRDGQKCPDHDHLTTMNGHMVRVCQISDWSQRYTSDVE